MTTHSTDSKSPLHPDAAADPRLQHGDTATLDRQLHDLLAARDDNAPYADGVKATNSNPVTYQQIQAVVADDFTTMDQQVFGTLNSRVKLVMAVSQHVIDAGGKRMRPLISLLCSRICDDRPSAKAMRLGAITEMLHTATLVHDDVIDASGMRRGKPTANATWDNPTAVLVGDYLIARAFNLLVEFGSLPLLKLFSDGTCDIAEGEVLQLQHQHDPEATESDYMRIIDGKTSRLFMLAAQGVSILHNRPEYEAAFVTFGLHFGNAFQIIDDILDFTGDSAVLGKNVGDDIAEGKPTLPLIKALEFTEGDTHETLRLAIQTGKVTDASVIIDIVQASGALDYCRGKAERESQLARASVLTLPPSPYRQGLLDLIELAQQRLY